MADLERDTPAFLGCSRAESDRAQSDSAFCCAGGQAARLAAARLVLPGDVIGFSGRSWQSWAINLGTFGVPGWGISHVGIVVQEPTTDRLLIAESTTTCPLACEVQRRPVRGLAVHRLEARIARYQGRVWRYPLTEPLDAVESRRLWEFTAQCLGTPYDLLGALHARSTLLGWVARKLWPGTLAALYCAEWTAVALYRLDRFGSSDYERWNPNGFCRALLRWGVAHQPERWK